MVPDAEGRLDTAVADITRLLVRQCVQTRRYVALRWVIDTEP